MDPATRYCNHCHDELPCPCPASSDYRDTLVVRLCLGAIAGADSEISYLEGRLLDRTGVRYVRTLQRIVDLFLVKAWCYRQLARRPARSVPQVEPIRGQHIDSILY